MSWEKTCDFSPINPIVTCCQDISKPYLVLEQFKYYHLYYQLFAHDEFRHEVFPILSLDNFYSTLYNVLYSQKYFSISYTLRLNNNKKIINMLVNLEFRISRFGEISQDASGKTQ